MKKQIPWFDIIGCYVFTPGLALFLALLFGGFAGEDLVMWLVTVFLSMIAVAYFAMSIVPFLAYLIIEIVGVLPAVLAVVPNAARRMWDEILERTMETG